MLEGLEDLGFGGVRWASLHREVESLGGQEEEDSANLVNGLALETFHDHLGHTGDGITVLFVFGELIWSSHGKRDR